MKRRSFIYQTGLAVTGMASSALVPVAGPFKPSDFSNSNIIPARKKLSKAWINSLFERGNPTVYQKTNNELRYIGMPCGGIGCGTMYAGGDGRLWLWDIFNENRLGVGAPSVPWHSDLYAGSNVRAQDGSAYVSPPLPQNNRPVEQGFEVEVVKSDGQKWIKQLDEQEWLHVSFEATYPIGTVRFSDPEFPVDVVMEVFSPFIPMDEHHSGLPATVFSIRIKNKTSEKIKVTVKGRLENAVGKKSNLDRYFPKYSKASTTYGITAAFCGIDMATTPAAEKNDDILIGNFESGDYTGWTTTGTAFGNQPFALNELEKITGKVDGQGQYVANSYNFRSTRPGENPDDLTGTLKSDPFKVIRKYLTFRIGGGNRPGETGVKILVNGEQVYAATGLNTNQMRREIVDMALWSGQMASIEIFDQAKGAWAQTGADDFRLTDSPMEGVKPSEIADYGSLCLAYLGENGMVSQVENLHFVQKQKTLRRNGFTDFDFTITWHFPNPGLGNKVTDANTGHYYARHFGDAFEVAKYIGQNKQNLFGNTRLWHKVWYDSTLPHWFLERTLVNVSTLATTTCHRFATGRFWAWEGVGCCEGTCTHVWQYAQSVGRLFPALELDQRKRVDLGVAFDITSMVIGHRGENTGPAIDGQAGTILRIYREHQMSTDNTFLLSNWRRIRNAVEYLIKHDANKDGLIDGQQDHTLDAAWYGEIAWISGLALAALRAGAEMAREAGDLEFAEKCNKQFETGKKSLENELFNGEYFIQRPDSEKGRQNFGAYNTCHIDQVYGQSWAWQVGLGRVIDKEKTMSALRSLWTYNYTPDVGPYIAAHKGWRPYALAGDGGMIMNTNPRNESKPYGENVTWQAGYFAECMSGFEHQVASHMMAEGMTEEAMILTRSIHDRYHAAKRNPFNEIECSDHYARAMASHGTFITACGFRSHGPSGLIGFNPALHPDHFKAPFTAAGGWGTFEQKSDHHKFTARITVHYGSINLNKIGLSPRGGSDKKYTQVLVKMGKQTQEANLKHDGHNDYTVHLHSPVQLTPGASLNIEIQ